MLVFRLPLRRAGDLGPLLVVVGVAWLFVSGWANYHNGRGGYLGFVGMNVLKSIMLWLGLALFMFGGVMTVNG